MAKGSLLNVTFVVKTALLKVSWISICEVILVKDPLNVQHVIKVLEDIVTCTCMCKGIQGTVNLNALSVIKVFHKRLN